MTMLTTATTTTKDEIQSLYVARIDELKREQSESQSNARVAPSNPPQFAAFFITLFVFGQVMSQWALLSGHFAAWIAGLLFSIVGITVTLVSLYSCLRERDGKIRAQSSLAGIPQHSRNDELLKRHASHLDFSGVDSTKVSA